MSPEALESTALVSDCLDQPARILFEVGRLITLALRCNLILDFDPNAWRSAACDRCNYPLLQASVGEPTQAYGLGATTVACAIFFWYGLEAIHRQSLGQRIRSQARSRSVGTENPKSSGIAEKIEHTLTDARVVLPGAQALLGFQLVPKMPFGTLLSAIGGTFK